MQRASAALQAAVQSDYQRVSRVKLIREGVVIQEVDVHSGSVTADGSAEQMRRFTAEVSDPTGERTPYDLDDDFAPFGTEVVVETGARIPVMSEVSLIVDSAADWSTGTRFQTSISGGDLVLGNI